MKIDATKLSTMKLNALKLHTIKIKVTLIVALLTLPLLSAAGNYLVNLDGTSYEVSLNEPVEVIVDGKPASLTIAKKEYFTYKTENFSFEHPSKFEPSRTDLGDGLLQTALMNPLGSVVLVQEYLYMNPSNMTAMMIAEVTKEEKEYGYTIKQEDHSITLSDGKVLSGKRVMAVYPGSNIERYFHTYGKKDAGLFVMTMVDYEVDPQGNEFVQRLLNSFSVSM